MGYVKQHLGVKLKRKSPVRQNHEDHMGHYSPLFLLVIDAQGNLLILTFHTHLHIVVVGANGSVSIWSHSGHLFTEQLSPKPYSDCGL